MIKLNEIIQSHIQKYYGTNRYTFVDNKEYVGHGETIIVRHSCRDNFGMGVNDNEVDLNEEGKQKAIEFGHMLVESHWFASNTRPCINFITSPIVRCVKTCKYITKGLNEGFNSKLGGYEHYSSISIPIKSLILGAPGPFVVDEQAGGVIFNKYGTCGAVEMLQNKTPLQGFNTLEDGAQKLMDFVKRETNHNRLTIMVTHDVVLAPFIHYYTGEYFNQEHWIDFLDGVLVKSNGEGSYHIYRNNEWWAV